MEPFREAVAKIEAWLREEFPSAHVESQGNFDREVWLFRARDKKAPTPAYELEVSYTAFEDSPSETIVTDLRPQLAGRRIESVQLTRDPAIRGRLVRYPNAPTFIRRLRGRTNSSLPTSPRRRSSRHPCIV